MKLITHEISKMGVLKSKMPTSLPRTKHFVFEKHLALFPLFTSVVGIKGRNYIYIYIYIILVLKKLAPSWVGAYLGNTMLLGHYPQWCGEY